MGCARACARVRVCVCVCVLSSFNFHKAYYLLDELVMGGELQVRSLAATGQCGLYACARVHARMHIRRSAGQGSCQATPGGCRGHMPWRTSQRVLRR